MSILDLLRPAWMLEGACRGVDTAVFFPDRGRSGRPAKEICAECPVARDCHDYAERDPSIVGIWGGQHWTRTTYRRGAA